MIILELDTQSNTVKDMSRISLAGAWGQAGLTPISFNIYKDMYTWLKNSNTPHRFVWDDTGSYLPSAIYIETNNDTATYFMLKYGLCK